MKAKYILFQIGFFGFCAALYTVLPYQIYAETDIRHPLVYSVFASATLFGAFLYHDLSKARGNNSRHSRLIIIGFILLTWALHLWPFCRLWDNAAQLWHVVLTSGIVFGIAACIDRFRSSRGGGERNEEPQSSGPPGLKD